MSIREIRGWTSTTVLPHSPEYVRGVINLRGNVLPVIDLKCRLGMGRPTTATHVIIVAAVGGRTVGLLVDAVSDIFYAADSDVQPAPDLSRTADLEHRRHRRGRQPHDLCDRHAGAAGRTVGDWTRRRDRMTVHQKSPALAVPDGEFPLTWEDFHRIAAPVHGQSGVRVLGDGKANLVYSRLAKRLRAIGLRNFHDYCDLVQSEQGTAERGALISALTTNVTRFFREEHHFKYLEEKVSAGAGPHSSRRPARIWSAGCSSILAGLHGQGDGAA